MSVDNPASPATGHSEAASARRLMRTALKGTLATIDQASGHPFASLVLVACTPDGSPVLMLSRLALHTRNLQNDPRASLLIDGTAEQADPLSGERVTFIGTVGPAATAKAKAKERFLARHPSAAGYAEFPDFAVYTLEVERGHFIAGFGRIVGLSRTALVSDTSDAAELVDAEAAIIAHMNADHADAVALYATELARCPPGAWRMCGIDPEGFDLLHCNMAARVSFPNRVRTPQEARAALVSLVKEARVIKEAK